MIYMSSIGFPMDPLMGFIWIPSGIPKDYLGNPHDGGERAMGRLKGLILGQKGLILSQKGLILSQK